LNDRVHWRSGPFTKAADPLGHYLRLSPIALKSRARGTRHVLHLDIDGETTKWTSDWRKNIPKTLREMKTKPGIQRLAQ
jgi:hypothetical protein